MSKINDDDDNWLERSREKEGTSSKLKTSPERTGAHAAGKLLASAEQHC